MTNLRKAAELALEALEINLPIAYAKNGRGERFPCFSDDPLREIKTREAIAALRQALEQPSDIDAAMLAERERIVDLLMIQHEAAKGAHNYWQVAANLIQADVASDT